MTPDAHDAHIESLVDEAPPLSAEQRSKLALIFGGTDHVTAQAA